jgi:hypothetical protein
MAELLRPCRVLAAQRRLAAQPQAWQVDADTRDNINYGGTGTAER